MAIDIDLRDDTPIFGNGFANGWLLNLYNEPSIAEHRTSRGRIIQAGRPAGVRVTGPTGGHRVVTDPDQLRREAARLLRAAELLEQAQDADRDLVLQQETAS